MRTECKSLDGLDTASPPVAAACPAAERGDGTSPGIHGDERFRSLFNAMDDGCCILEVAYAGDGRIADLHFLDVNAAFERQGGFHAVVGKPVSHFMPNLESYWSDAFTRVMRTGEPVRMENQLADSGRWYHVNFMRIGGAGSRLLAAVFRDVTERKRTEAAAREIEERQAFLLKLGDAIRPLADGLAIQREACRALRVQIGVDRVCYCEPDAREESILITAEDAGPGFPLLTGQRFRVDDFQPGASAMFRDQRPVGHEDLETLVELSPQQRAAFAALRIRAYLAVPLVKDGRLAAALIAKSASPHRWLAAEISLLAETTERTWDAVGRARMESELRESGRRLTRASRAKDEFIAMLSHELRNPLAPIVSTLQLMKLRAPDAFVHERGVIEAQVDHLVGMVDDLLDVARIAGGKIDLRHARVPVAGIVGAAVEATQPILEEHRQTLHAHVEDGLAVVGDRRRLVQVLVNILVNAAKYSPPDRGIYLAAAAESGQAVLRVRDEGRGIDPELLPHVFELFTQDSRAIDRSGGGLGLGLAIVRNLVELHGGSVEARSGGGGLGSELVVRLPLAEPEADHDGAVMDPPAGDAASTEGGCGAKVLIVDDYALGADSLARLLQAMGYRTHVVYDGAAAIRAVSEFAPDIALVDIGLPVMDGYAVARSVRTTAGIERLPLVAVTGYGQASDRVRVMEAGFDEHLVKPLDAAGIGRLIDRLVAVRPVA